MAHKTSIGGTAYDIGGGKTLVEGTSYSVKNGKVLIDGTEYDISFILPGNGVGFMERAALPVVSFVSSMLMATG